MSTNLISASDSYSINASTLETVILCTPLLGMAATVIPLFNSIVGLEEIKKETQELYTQTLKAEEAQLSLNSSLSKVAGEALEESPAKHQGEIEKIKDKANTDMDNIKNLLIKAKSLIASKNRIFQRLAFVGKCGLISSLSTIAGVVAILAVGIFVTTQFAIPVMYPICVCAAIPLTLSGFYCAGYAYAAFTL